MVLDLTRICNLLLKNAFLRLKYEEFVKDPAINLKIISEFIGVEYCDAMTNLNSKTHHMIGGNASRINATEIKYSPVKLQNLTKLNRISFSMVAGWLNKVLGYPFY